MGHFKCNSYKSLKRTSCKGDEKYKHPLFTHGLSCERIYRRQTGKMSQNKCHLFSLNQERSQKEDSGCASEKLGVPHLLSD